MNTKANSRMAATVLEGKRREEITTLLEELHKRMDEVQERLNVLKSGMAPVLLDEVGSTDLPDAVPQMVRHSPTGARIMEAIAIANALCSELADLRARLDL